MTRLASDSRRVQAGASQLQGQYGACATLAVVEGGGHFASATSSISTRAPSGSAATPMVVRAG
jgi:hypothetical protein